jgi:hypothetical protein
VKGSHSQVSAMMIEISAKSTLEVSDGIAMLSRLAA